jgi:hypothetical protein
MIPEQVLRTIEGHRFAAEINLASGSRAFHSGLRSNGIFQALMEYMKEPNAPQTVLKRIIELAARPVQLPFENPFDTALAAYLTALDLTSPELVKHGAEAVSKAENCWWATEMSLRLLARTHQGQMPIPISHPGANPNALGANPSKSSNPRPSYRLVRAGGRSVSGHRRRHGGRLAVA